MPDTSRQPRRLAPSPKQDREIINVCCSGPRSARAWPSQPGVSLDGPALSCSGTAPPRWSAPLRHQAPDCCREACTRVRGGCASCWARPLAARDCEDSVHAAAPGPLRPPCRALPAIQSGIRGTPRGASLSRSPPPGASSLPALHIWGLGSALCVRAFPGTGCWSSRFSTENAVRLHRSSLVCFLGNILFHNCAGEERIQYIRPSVFPELQKIYTVSHLRTER